jgi:hypothetical protein
MTLEEALKARDAAKEKLLEGRKVIAQCEERIAHFKAEAARERAGLQQRERAYLDAVNKVKALLDADVAGTMGKKRESEPAEAAQ